MQPKARCALLLAALAAVACLVGHVSESHRKQRVNIRPRALDAYIGIPIADVVDALGQDVIEISIIDEPPCCARGINCTMARGENLILFFDHNLPELEVVSVSRQWDMKTFIKLPTIGACFLSRKERLCAGTVPVTFVPITISHH
jgi:hypothetical protein